LPEGTELEVVLPDDGDELDDEEVEQLNTRSSTSH
jgi:hypothetical protein